MSECPPCLAEARRRAAVSGRSVVAEYGDVVREPLAPCLAELWAAVGRLADEAFAGALQ